ncbi:MAG TPA: helix-turn-helix transcriptional regulator [Nordella sp.]|nr:helix-turn-helix transcriptional regulator [Nordella sp.]
MSDVDLLLDALYDAAVSYEAWPLVCDRLATVAGARGTMIIPGSVEARAQGIPHSASVQQLFDDYLRDGWYLRDERTVSFRLFQRTPVVFDQDFTAPDAMSKSSYYQDFLGRSGLKWFAGIGFRVQGEWWAAAIQRTEEQGPFSDASRHELAQFSKHLSRAAGMANALNYSKAEGALEAFQKMSIGAIAIDAGENVISVNAAAQSLLGDGIQITKNRLRAIDLNTCSQLEALVQAGLRGTQLAQKPAPGMVMVPRPSGRRSYRVSTCPLGQRAMSVFGQARLIILIIDPEQKRNPDAELLRAHFRLTPREAKLAEQLAAGRTLQDAAAALSITSETARSYLKSIFSKTGTHKQGQLVSLLGSALVLSGESGVRRAGNAERR